MVYATAYWNQRASPYFSLRPGSLEMLQITGFPKTGADTFYRVYFGVHWSFNYKGMI